MLGIYKPLMKKKILTRDQEQELIFKAQNGDIIARDEMVKKNLKLVISICRKGNFPVTEDCIQDGILGLIRAIEKFDLSKGNKFSTYATWWIMQSRNRESYNYHTYRLPAHIWEKRGKFAKYTTEFYQKNDRVPTYEEISKKFNVTLESVKNTLELPQIISMDKKDLDGELPHEKIEDEGAANITEINIRNSILNDAFQTLSEREKKVIELRYNQSMTLEAIGKVFNISKERIRQIRITAENKMKIYLKKKGIHSMNELM